MPLELLQKFSREALPLTVTDLTEIDKLRVLEAAGHVVVRLRSPEEEKQVAQVLSITPKGQEALSNYVSETG